MKTHLTIAQRRERGETIINRRGVELVHGRVLAREILADYDALLEESNRAYHAVSPFRSDYAEINAAIDEEIQSKAGELAYAIKQWLDDEEWEQTQRDEAVSRIAWTA